MLIVHGIVQSIVSAVLIWTTDKFRAPPILTEAYSWSSECFFLRGGHATTRCRSRHVSQTSPWGWRSLSTSFWILASDALLGKLFFTIIYMILWIGKGLMWFNAYISLEELFTNVDISRLLRKNPRGVFRLSGDATYAHRCVGNPSFRDELLSNYKTRSLHWNAQAVPHVPCWHQSRFYKLGSRAPETLPQLQH